MKLHLIFFKSKYLKMYTKHIRRLNRHKASITLFLFSKRLESRKKNNIFGTLVLSLSYYISQTRGDYGKKILNSKTYVHG